MNRNILFLITILGSLLISCSKDDDAGDIQTPVARLQSIGKVYLKLTLKQTSSGRTTTTRANDDYDHGTTEEYAIHDAVVVFFSRNTETENEGQSHFLHAVRLTDSDDSSIPVNNQITQDKTYLVPINTARWWVPTGHNRLEAYIIANTQDLVTAGNEGNLQVKGNIYGPDDINFKTLTEITMNNIGTLTTGILMTSAPIADRAGGTDKPTGVKISTLRPVDIKKLYITPTDAKDNPALEVYLERAAAKVEVKTAAGIKSTTDDGVPFTPSGIRWDVENVNTTYYLGRQIASIDHTLGSSLAPVASKYRFIASEQLQTADAHYRTYWAEDINYDNGTGLVCHYNSTMQVPMPNDLSTAEYIVENTVDASHMTQDLTTGLVLTVPFNDGNDFYVLSLTGTGTIYENEDKLKDKIRELVEAQPAMDTWRKADVSHASTVVKVDLLYADGVNKLNNGSIIQPGKVSIRLSATDMDVSLASILALEIENLTDITYYKNGLSYYKVMIKHFGDHETPLPSNVDHNSKYETLYGNPANTDNFLGRFGVVRDTWYIIEIQGVKHLGFATIPTFTPTPDDNSEYLKIEIVILPWMMHTQNLDF